MHAAVYATLDEMETVDKKPSTFNWYLKIGFHSFKFPGQFRIWSWIAQLNFLQDHSQLVFWNFKEFLYVCIVQVALIHQSHVYWLIKILQFLKRFAQGTFL